MSLAQHSGSTLTTTIQLRLFLQLIDKFEVLMLRVEHVTLTSTHYIRLVSILLLLMIPIAECKINMYSQFPASRAPTK